MLYLIGAVFSSALVSIVMKAGKPYIKSNSLALAVNYLICLILSLVFVGSIDLFPQADGLTFTMLLGVISGFIYVAAYMLLQWNIAHNGAVLGATFMKLGVLVPTVMAIVWFREQPSTLQIAGLVLAIAAILLINLEKGGDAGGRRSNTKWALVLLLIGGGMCDGLSKVYEVYGNPALESHYLLYLFFVAFLFCVSTCLVKKERPCGQDLLFGALIGIPNYFSTRFLLKALSYVPAVVAYPTYSVSTIIVVMAVGILCFKERITKKQWIAIGIILAALVLLNV